MKLRETYKVKIWSHRELEVVVGDLNADPGHELHFTCGEASLEKLNVHLI